ncbi:3567_t:CDS:2 [Cetraspora pellucida]|uniref:3567_t:CDS:1 n=1 Tax=Cetraspora pellucida TaxID=1433469 RepID=A0A9N9FGC5_9GLOM|nr:3567_t:CDS:2 [Cetraspora pellucida]
MFLNNSTRTMFFKKLPLLVILTLFIVTLSEASFNLDKRNKPKICRNALLSATFEMDLKGQMSFYQDQEGQVWLSGTYQSGFQKPGSWDYCWTLQNGCGEIIYNLTDQLNMEYTKGSGCNGYDDSKSSYKRRGGYLDKRHHKEECEAGEWGTKPWVVKVGDLTWDCGKDGGFKYQTCEGKDIYKDKVVDYTKQKLPKRLSDQGSTSGIYLVVDGQSKWGKRATINSPAAINVNNEGNVVAPPPPAQPAPAPPAPAPAPPAPAPAPPAPAPAPPAPAPAPPAPAPAPPAPAPAPPAPAPAPPAPAPAPPAPAPAPPAPAPPASAPAPPAPATAAPATAANTASNTPGLSIEAVPGSVTVESNTAPPPVTAANTAQQLLLQ